MKYALFLGCVIPNRYPGIELALRNVVSAVGIELQDMEGASCCPAPGVFKSFHQPTWLALAARNLCIAEAMDMDIITPCNGCYGTLREANTILKQDTARRKEANRILHDFNKEFKGKIEVKNFVQAIYNDIQPKGLKQLLKRPLNLSVGVQYGCHLLKPTKYRDGLGVERPTFLDELVEALGAKSVPYREKMMCCGAGGGVKASNPEVSLDMAREKLQNMKEAGAECIVTPCAFCHLQFDRTQMNIRDMSGNKFNLPVFHYAQFLGLAIGLKPEQLGVYNNATPVDAIIQKI